MKHQLRSLYSLVILAFGGNFLEWYDISLYAVLSPIIAQNLYSDFSYSTSLFIVLSNFIIGYLMRPIGGILFGYLGDRYNRRLSLMFSIKLMIFATVAIGFCPSYQQAGVLSFVWLTVARLLQGLALGGNFSISFVYAYEQSTKHKKILNTSIIHAISFVAVSIGMLVANACIYLTHSHPQYPWWRYAFIASIIIGFVIIYFRQKFIDHHDMPQQQTSIPLYHLLLHYPKQCTYGVFMPASLAVANYFLTAYLAIYLQQTMKFSLYISTNIMIIISLFSAMIIPLFGLLAERPQWATKLSWCSLAIGALCSPFILFALSVINTWPSMLILLIIFTINCAIISALIPYWTIRLFPVAVRCSGMATTWNISMTLFGSTTPLLCHILLNLPAIVFPVYYSIISFISLLVFFKVKQTVVKTDNQLALAQDQ